MKPFVNIFACLVHDSPECVVDLVRNLRGLDPDSIVLLYNGGSDEELLASPVLPRLGAIVHPAPQKMQWGRLHGFALDAMRFALAEFAFDTLTIVDSDQLAIRCGYSAFLKGHMAEGSRLGMLGSVAQRQTPQTRIAPVRTFFSEMDLWTSFFQQFPRAEEKLLYWTFWPSTVFTAEAARELTRLWDSNEEPEALLSRSQLWATEEVLLPTLVAMLGFEIGKNPASDAYVQFRRSYTFADVEKALHSPSAFWMHPIPRRYDDALRVRLRRNFNEYRTTSAGKLTAEAAGDGPRLLRPAKVIADMRRIDGWLEDIEGDLLMASALDALRTHPQPCNLVEIGSYYGRSTSVLGSVVKSISPESRVWAIDPHDGVVGALDEGLRSGSPTFERFRANMAAAGVDDVIHPMLQKSYQVDWKEPVHLLLIDGLHDYVNVSRDFLHFEPWIASGGLILFHDYASYYPGVMAFVDELLSGGGYRRVELAHTLILLQKIGAGEAALGDTVAGQSSAVPVHACRWRESGVRHTPAAEPLPAPAVLGGMPLVSCIMPTANRRALLTQAIEYFRRQDYPHLELIIIDDGVESVEDLVAGDARIRYERLDRVHTMGTKHNMACERALGEIIVHWDDDDWMAPWRVSYQVDDLLRVPCALCGLSTLFFYEPESRRAWRYRYPAGSQAWVSGGTFCYRRRFREMHPFPDLNEGADTRFVWDLPGNSVHAHADPSFYVATIHSRNTSVRRLHDARYSPHPGEEIERLLGGDLEFYRRWPLATEVAPHPQSP